MLPYAACSEADLSGRDLSGLNLTGGNFIRAKVDRANLSGSTLDRADFVLASAAGATFDGAAMDRTDFTGTNLSNASLRNVNAPGLDISQANASGVNFSNANLSGAVARGANLTGAVLAGATLTDVDFTGATWVDGKQCQEGSIGQCITGEPDDPIQCVIGPKAQCAKANLIGRDLRGANLTGANLVEARLDEANATNATFVRADVVSASLLGIKLGQANLADGDFTNSALGEASLQGVQGSGLDASWSDMTKANLADADLTTATLGGSRAVEANFSRANLSNADVSAVSFARANLTGTNFTNAIMRRADLRGATITDAVFTGADLTGATWVNGRTCAEDSIGRCITPATEVVTDEASLGNPFMVILSLVTSSIALARFADDCASNVPLTGNCLSTGQRGQLTGIQASINELKAQIEKNQQQLERALGLVFAEQKYAAVRDNYRRISADLRFTEIAALKMAELSACIDAVDKGLGKCTVTNSEGKLPTDYTLRTGEDLYVGANIPASGNLADWRPTEAMASAGPVARLLYATLYRFGREADGTLSPQKLKDKGTQIQAAMADRSTLGEGLLPALVSWQNATLNVDQGAPVGTPVPGFIPGEYLVNMNALASNLIGSQVNYYAPIMAALSFLAPRGGPAPQIVKELEDLSLNGPVNRPEEGLDGAKGQVKTFLTDFSTLEIDPAITTPIESPSNRPERVGFVLGGNGTLYRIQHVHGATEYGDAYPNFDLPTYSTLEQVQRGLARSGVKMSTLQRLYPYKLPSGPVPAAWWAKYGSGYRVVDIAQFQDPTVAKTTLVSKWQYITAPTSGPGEIYKWGDNVTQARHDVPCRIPVRMWDARPSFEDSARADGGAQPSNQQFWALNNQKRGEVQIPAPPRNSFGITFDAKSNFGQIVTTGAAPAFDIAKSWRQRETSPQLMGTGVLWKCGGRGGSDFAQRVPSEWVSVTPVEPNGILSYLFPAKK